MNDLYNIVEIGDEYILTKDKIIKLIEVKPINFELMSNLEQKALINNFRNFILNLNSNFQIQIKILKLDQNKTIHYLNEQRKLDTDIIDDDLYESYINLLNNIAKNENVNTKKYYFVMSTSYFQTNKHQKLEESRLMSEHLISEFKKINNDAIVLGEKEIKEIIKDFYN